MAESAEYRLDPETKTAPTTQRVTPNDAVRTLMERIDRLGETLDRIENKVAVLEFYRINIYEHLESLIIESMERDKKTWVAGSKGGVG